MTNTVVYVADWVALRVKEGVLVSSLAIDGDVLVQFDGEDRPVRVPQEEAHNTPPRLW